MEPKYVFQGSQKKKDHIWLMFYYKMEGLQLMMKMIQNVLIWYVLFKRTSFVNKYIFVLYYNI